MKIIKYLLESLIIYFFFVIIKLIGLNLSRKLFSYFFYLIGPYIKSKKIVEQNIRKISPEIEILELKKLIRNMWFNYGMTFVEYIYLHKFRKSNDHVQIKGEHILNNIREQKKPVIFVSGHFANYELMSMEIIKQKINLATIYRPLNNIFLNPYMEFLRKKYVCGNQIKKGLSGVKDAIRYIEKNYSIALMIDQRLSEGESVPFFNESALTTTLPAQLAQKFNLDIVPVYIYRTNSNNFEIEFFEPIKINTRSEKIETTLKLNQILEKMVKKNPSQWILTHNRWK